MGELKKVRSNITLAVWPSHLRVVEYNGLNVYMLIIDGVVTYLIKSHGEFKSVIFSDMYPNTVYLKSRNTDVIKP